MRTYPLRKSKSILRHTYGLFQKKKSILTHEALDEMKSTLMELQDAILNHNRDKASDYARETERLCKEHLRKDFFFQIRESVIALAIALFLAVLIRQTWFEFYAIPSGSMRPTLKEEDKLVVTKTQFGLNVPLKAAHVFFKPDEVKRMGIIHFTGEGMDIPNLKTRYFYLFPGVKQYVKRMIGLPGDTLYFYGGRIYGLDAQGNDISSELQKAELSHLEHIPFLNLEGRINAPSSPINELYSPVIMEHTGIPLAKLYLGNQMEVHHEMLSKEEGKQNLDVYDFWGIGNFASARILTREELALYYDNPLSRLPYSHFYLEMTHHPSAKKSHIQKDQYFRNRPKVDLERSFIPLNDSHMRAIWENLYTSRFIFEKGYFRRYGMTPEELYNNGFIPKIKGGIPDGMYEFQDGQLYKVGLMGMSEKAPDSHPLAQYTPENCYLLYNIGIECDRRFLIRSVLGLTPARYAYFRDRDLYLMGQPIFTKDESTLQTFIASEEKRRENNNTYVPFVDHGPPVMSDGSLDVDFIKTHGLTIPDKHYFVLGDNHAVSADSRDFGFVPEENLRGVPTFIFWASNNRYGFPNNGTYPFFTLPRTFVWLIFAGLFSIWGFFHYRRNRLPLQFD